MAKPLSVIELRHLRYFLAAAQHGSLRRAAVALRVRGSTISRRIRDLEHHLGADLFHRHHAGVRLTEAGGVFLRDAQATLNRLDDGCSSVRGAAFGRRGRLRLAAAEEVVGERLGRILAAHRARCPDVCVDFREMLAGDQSRALDDGGLDLGLTLTGGNPAHLVGEALWSKGCVVALPLSHPLVSRLTLTCADLDGVGIVMGHAARGPHCGRHAIETLRQERAEVRPTAEVEHVRTMLMLVQAGSGIAFLPAPFAASAVNGVVFRDVTDIVGGYTVQAAWLAGDPSGLVGQFLRTARAIIADEQADERVSCGKASRA